MIITLKNSSSPISLTDLYTAKGYFKSYSPKLKSAKKLIRSTLKSTAFYSFWLIGTSEVDN